MKTKTKILLFVLFMILTIIVVRYIYISSIEDRLNNPITGNAIKEEDKPIIKEVDEINNNNNNNNNNQKIDENKTKENPIIENKTPITKNEDIPRIKKEISIASWNLQIFGKAKAENFQLLKNYSQIIGQYDIIFIQEIRDEKGNSFKELCSMLPSFECINSSRAGTTSSKEQIGIIYKRGINLSLFDFNPLEQDYYERPPIKVDINIEGNNITAYNIHIKPEQVSIELTNLEETIVNNGKVILMGDLNADCSYYNPQLQTHFMGWFWLIKDFEDTTSSNSNCAYDRILLNNGAKSNYLEHGIHTENITEAMSDHYLIWVKFRI
ncbi:MAG: endonuclease/exonuclease/phosphatase family protein [Candidatus Pacearchaeota archaeon]